MKIVIMAGGFPSAINDEDEGIPKPMLEIGERPILWHIMKYYSSFGIKDFIICAGYKSEMIKDYFQNYYIYQSDISVDLQNNEVQIFNKVTENWNVIIANTGLSATVGERMMAIKGYVGDEDFMVVYGDCLSNIDYNKLLKKHLSGKKVATVTLAHPNGRNTIIPVSDEDRILKECDKNIDSDAWINACTVIFTPQIFEYLSEVKKINMELPLYNLLNEKSDLVTYKHEGFFSAVETKRDKIELEQLWEKGQAPWRRWKD